MAKEAKLIMKVNKNLYLEISDKKFRWTTEKRDDIKVVKMVKAGRFLAFRNYCYSIINPVTEDDMKNAMTIIMNEIDSLRNQDFPLGQIEIHPYELNELIKEDAIQII